VSALSPAPLSGSAAIAAASLRHPELVRPSFGTRARAIAPWGLLAVGLGAGLWWVDATPSRLLSGLGRLGWLVPHMLPPSHGGWLGEFLWALLESVAMALLGTLAAAVAAVPLGFLGARTVVGSWILHVLARRVFDGLRGVDALIWALIFVGVVGLGPFAGVLALAMADVGTFAKLFAEAVEHVDRRPVEGVRATGATAVQVLRFAVLPQVLPVWLSTVLYYFESNVRSATILGVVGAGGIGHQLSDRIRVNAWDQVAFIVVLILATVAVIDALSRALRRGVLGEAGARRAV
jgi:phosphonate transport system permease protein